MTEIKNPFSPSFARVPEIFIDRENLVKDTVKRILQKDPMYQTTLIYGARGSGKTTFITDVGKQISSNKNWITVDLSMASKDLIKDLADELEVKAESEVRQFLKEFQGGGFSFAGFGVNVSRKIKEIPSNIFVERVLANLTEKGVNVLVTLDEVVSNDSMREFASFFQLLVRKDIAISLILAGLPENVTTIETDTILTFLLRSNKLTLTPLDKFDVMGSYKETFTKGDRNFSEDGLLTAVSYVKGYAYAFQLIGYLLWESSNAGDEINVDRVKAIKKDYIERLSRNVYTMIYHQLSDVDRSFVNAMARSEARETKMSTIKKALGVNSQYANIYRNRLLAAQLITSSKYGYVAFNLPMFIEFLLQQAKFDDFDL